MKNRVELANIACMTSTEVVGVTCIFELPSRHNPYPKTYLYKCPSDLAATLEKGMLVLAEYEGQQASNKDRPAVPVIVHEIHESFDPEDMLIPYKWIFDVVDMTTADRLRQWELDTTDALVKSQRRRARETVLREVLGEAPNRPEFPKLTLASINRASQEDFGVVETVPPSKE